MKITQQNKILALLQEGRWVCVNEFIDTYCVDYRRRLVDLKEKGHQLISRKCLRHHHHSGSKEWRLLSAIEKPVFDVQKWQSQFKPVEENKQLSLGL